MSRLTERNLSLAVPWPRVHFRAFAHAHVLAPLRWSGASKRGWHLKGSLMSLRDPEKRVPAEVVGTCCPASEKRVRVRLICQAGAQQSVLGKKTPKVSTVHTWLNFGLPLRNDAELKSLLKGPVPL